MEDIKDLYEQFEAELIARPARGQKADMIREFVRNAASYMGTTRIALNAIYKVAVLKIPRTEKALDKTYFKSVVAKTWELERDENHVVWIRLDRPK